MGGGENLPEIAFGHPRQRMEGIGTGGSPIRIRETFPATSQVRLYAANRRLQPQSKRVYQLRHLAWRFVYNSRVR